MIQDIAPRKLWNEYRLRRPPRRGDKILVIRGRTILIRSQEVSVQEAAGPVQEQTDASQERAGLSQEHAGASSDQRMEFPVFEDFSGIPALIYLFSIDDTGYYLADEEGITTGGGEKEEMAGSHEDGGAFEEEPLQVPLKGPLQVPLKGPSQVSLPSGFAFYEYRELRNRHMGPDFEHFAACTALQLAGWYRDNRFCGTCGHRTVPDQQERAMRCTECGRVIYPRILPAVIVGVLDPRQDKIVLTRYANRRISYYALVAGFTEIGETLEETVVREVMEEVGLRVKNIRYYKSQPWGIADDILMGFFCEVDGDSTIRMDADELKEAGWKSREEVVLQPDEFSLTNEMMRMFKEGKI